MWPQQAADSGVPPSQRGDRLPAGIAVKATRFELLANATVEQALVRILRHCLAHLRANEPVLLETDEPGGVHQIRVALRRMRSAFRLFRPYLSGARYRALGGEMIWLTARLEAAREWDVLRHQIVEPVMTATEGGEGGFDALLSRIDNARHEARRAARDAVRSPRYGRFLADIDGWIAHRAWRDVVSDGSPFDTSMTAVAGPLLTDCRDRMVARGWDFAAQSPAQRHRLRIAVKRLRYATDFFGSLYDHETVEPFATRLAVLQDSLGYRNDIAVARRLIGGSNDAVAMVLDWHDRASAQSEAELAGDVDEFIGCELYWPRLVTGEGHRPMSVLGPDCVKTAPERSRRDYL